MLLFEESAQFEHEKLLINKWGAFGQSSYKILNRNAMVHWISIKLCTFTAVIKWPKSKLQLGWNNTWWPFLAFQRWLYKKENGWIFLGIIFYQIYCDIFSYIPFTFTQTAKCFLSYGTKNVHILAELQAVRFAYAILGKNFKKGPILKILY